MSDWTLDSIVAARAKLMEELRMLDQQEQNIKRQRAPGVFDEIGALLSIYAGLLSDVQKAELIDLINGKNRAPRGGGRLAPRYWLPDSGEIWTGRGKTPRAFVAWMGTSAYKDWKALNPHEKFPRYPR